MKVQRSLTLNHRLSGYGNALDRFLAEVAGLGAKLGVLLRQLLPSFVFDEAVATAFFHDIACAGVAVACEPRHAIWFETDADRVLKSVRVARVAADPPRAPADGMSGGDLALGYFRLHDSPQIYYSDYRDGGLARWASQLRPDDWCIFDNSAAHHALANALSLARLRNPL